MMKRALCLAISLLHLGGTPAFAVPAVVAADSGTHTLNCTGANFVAVVTAHAFAGNDGVAPTDTSSNAWTQVGTTVSSGSYARAELWVAANATVSGSQTFSYAAGFGDLAALCLSGMATSSTLDQQNQATGGSPISAGSVMPGSNNQIIIAGVAADNVGSAPPTFTLGSGFIKFYDNASGGSVSMAAGYKIQTTAGAENPLWTFVFAGTSLSSKIATFKSSGASPPAASGKVVVNVMN